MSSRQPLARRIILSFTLLTVLIAGINAWAIVAVIEQVEDYLIGDEMRQEMAAVETVYLTEGRIPDLTGGSALYAPSLRGPALPAEFDAVHTGFQEVITPDSAWYVLDSEIDGHRFVMVRNQDVFEAREVMLHKVVGGGFLLAVALAWVIGRVTVRRVIDPVIRLAHDVRERESGVHEHGPTAAPPVPLAPAYGDDELGQLARAFDHAFAELHAALERERLFTSDVSHELRTPLMIVGTSAELLARADLPESNRRQIARIKHAAEDMQGLVDTFLQLARAVRATADEGITLRALADEQCAVWEPEIRARGLNFVYRPDDALVQRWHPTLLRVVMDNLLRNALHYTEQGEIRLLLNDEGFAVEDTGPGIPPDELGRIFEPFQRGRRARGEGLGLGLSLVRRICEQQGWTVTATDSESGKGSRFSVRLTA